MAMKLKVEMTLTAATAQRLKEAGERIAAQDLGEDGMLAAAPYADCRRLRTGAPREGCGNNPRREPQRRK
jgi:hypothetical protein